jgi:hypothetical protein
MGLLESLLGTEGQRQDFQDFVNRYHDGPPEVGYSGQEVLNRYQQVAPQMPAEDYERAAQEAFQRMSPQQRAGFLQYLQQQTQGQNIPWPAGTAPTTPVLPQDPSALAQIVTGLHQQQPGLLGQLLGGGGGGGGSLLDNPAAKAALAGIAAIAVKNLMARR